MTEKVCFVVGARPNFMKSAPVYRCLQELESGFELKLIHTGQHYDAEMSDVFIGELGLPQPHAFLDVGSGTHGEQTAKALAGVERVLLDEQPSLVVVAGDVNSTLAAALAAAKLQIPVAHIESGLRSFDETMPEEANRRLTDHLSQILFAHSEGAVENLVREGIDLARVHLVGNTMIDSVLRYLPAGEAGQPWLDLGVERGRFGLVTLHRPGVVDDPSLLRQTVDALADLAREITLVFPVHPRTRSRLVDSGIDPEALAEGGLKMCEPLGYLEFLALEAHAAFVLTDSGGIQEETSALGVRCFTFRNSTERPVTVELGTNTVLGVDPRRIREIPALLAVHRAAKPIPLWDGQAGIRAAAILANFLAKSDEGPPPGAGLRESRRGERLGVAPLAPPQDQSDPEQRAAHDHRGEE
jgi:UDP-N-acetylglucosamine 2-epimerase (non-hydrolysing)